MEQKPLMEIRRWEQRKENDGELGQHEKHLGWEAGAGMQAAVTGGRPPSPSIHPTERLFLILCSVTLTPSIQSLFSARPCAGSLEPL